MTAAIVAQNRRFFALSEVPGLFAPVTTRLRVLMLADDRHPANVVQDHIQGFIDHSGHRITVANSRYVVAPEAYRDEYFDAILIHYSIYTIADTYLSRDWQQFIADFTGVVAVIHEDEYQKINAFKEKFAELGVQAVFSCLDNVANLERVYGGAALPQTTRFFCCLPGYVSPGLKHMQAPAVRGRPFDVVYRGRTLPPELGRFAQEKRLIGEHMLQIAGAKGLVCDISSAEEARIYGAQWPRFLTSGKAMLGVEGGASIFDFDGGINAAVERYRKDHPQAGFDAIWSVVLAPHEGNITFKTITPKFFEAIAARTALVLYPGHYSGVLEPDRHYIVLERDGSNADEVVARLKDDDYLEALVDRTWHEILCKPELSSAFYVEQIDRVLASLVHAGARRRAPGAAVGIASSAAVTELRQDLAKALGAIDRAREALSVMGKDLAMLQQESAAIRCDLAALKLQFQARSADGPIVRFLKAIFRKSRRLIRTWI